MYGPKINLTIENCMCIKKNTTVVESASQCCIPFADTSHIHISTHEWKKKLKLNKWKLNKQNFQSFFFFFFYVQPINVYNTIDCCYNNNKKIETHIWSYAFIIVWQPYDIPFLLLSRIIQFLRTTVIESCVNKTCWFHLLPGASQYYNNRASTFS